MADADRSPRKVAFRLFVTFDRPDVQEVAVAEMGADKLSLLKQEGNELIAEIEE